MLRRTLRVNARPFGPKGQAKHNIEPTLTLSVNRSEYWMTYDQSLKQRQHRTWGNMRALQKRYSNQFADHGCFGRRAPPRDLGEFPRNYALKTLLANQPATLVTLWKLILERDDAPFDSRDHLEDTLRLAQELGWVFRERSQADSTFYFSVVQERTAAVQAMARADVDAQRLEEERKALAEEEAVAQKRADRAHAVDNAIVQLQNRLLANVCKIKEYDPEAAARLPFVTPTGAVNCTWHWDGRTGQREDATPTADAGASGTTSL